MATLGLAYINAKYAIKDDGLFFATFVIDVVLIDAVASVLGG